jgi:chorismate mutase
MAGGEGRTGGLDGAGTKGDRGAPAGGEGRTSGLDGAGAKGDRGAPAGGEGRTGGLGGAGTKGDRGAPAGGLAALRGEIDAIDDRLLELLGRRAAIAAELGGLKPEARDAGREAAVLARLSRANPGPLPDAALARIFREIFGACLDVQKEDA